MSTTPDPAPAPTARVTSLDAYRGFVMLAMASAGLGIATVADHTPENPWLGMIGAQVEHVLWRGCVFWDLIQPSFIFLVGASLPFSNAARKAKGDSFGRRLGHAVVRSAVLVALGVFLASNGAKQTEWTFTNVLAQIGLGYVFVYLIAQLPNWGVIFAALWILVVDWIAFALYNFPIEQVDRLALGWTSSWRPMPGLFFHWEKNVNVAAAFDRWFLNLFPRPDGVSFAFNGGGYTTLNFVPSMATALLGVLAGRLLASGATRVARVRTLFLAGAAGVVVGMVLDDTFCPVVKRIWTPSWTIYSAGWASILLAGFVLLFDGRRGRSLAFPLVVVGANSIVMYLMAQLIKPWVRGTLRTHLNTGFEFLRSLYPAVDWPSVQKSGLLFGGEFGPIWDAVAVLAVLWLICLWLYRARIFVKI